MANGEELVREEGAGGSIFDNLIGVIVSPSATFERIVRKPTWLFPIVLLVVLSAIIGYLLRDLIWDNAFQQMQANPNFDAEKAAATLGTIEKFTKIAAWAAPIITIPLIYAIIAGILLFVGNIVLGKQSTFKTIFSVTSWSGIVSMVVALVNMPLMLNKGEFGNATALTFLAPDAEKTSATFFLLSQLDLAYIWWVAVLGIGFAAAYKLNTQKGVVTVFTVWAIYLAAVVGFKALF